MTPARLTVMGNGGYRMCTPTTAHWFARPAIGPFAIVSRLRCRFASAAATANSAGWP